MAKKGKRSIFAKRTAWVLGFFGLFFVVIIGNLIKIQIIDATFYQERAFEQQTRDTVITPARGTIYDRTMKKLAESATVETIFISPKDIKEEQREEIARGLSDILGVNYDTIIEKSKKNTYYQEIKKKVEKEEADLVRAFKLEHNYDAIHLEEDTKRYYPFADFAAHVIGFTDIDNKGTYGIEGYYNDLLTGVSGRVIAAKDAGGKDMPFQFREYYDAQNGQNIVLTLDEGVQHYLEKHLETALIDNDCDNRVTGIVMDIKTGGILAMATLPDFDPNNKNEILDPKILARLEAEPAETKSEATGQAIYDSWRNKAIVDAYDPGSTFKILTTAMGLEEAVVKTSDTFSCNGSAKVALKSGSRTIRCWQSRGHGHQNFIEGVQNSCNPVFIEIGRRLGSKTFYNYMSLLGLRDTTGIDLPGEAKGIFHSEKSFNELELATASFGQNFSVTPIQLITAVAAVANGGQYVKPHLLGALVDDDGNIISTYKPETVKQIISKSTSDTVCEILESVVTEGTGGGAYVKGYRVAGKTGTSEKIAKQNELGVEGLRIASFIGFAPADDPKVAVLVMLDEPNGPIKYGGVIAAPVVGRIMSDVLPYLGIEPRYTEEEAQSLSIAVPNLVNMSTKDAQAVLKTKGLSFKVVGDGDTVTEQLPIAGVNIPATAEMVLYCGAQKETRDVTVPSFENMNIASVLAVGKQNGLYINTRGAVASAKQGVVAKHQNPAAGTIVKNGTVVTVEFVDVTQTD